MLVEAVGENRDEPSVHRESPRKSGILPVWMMSALIAHDVEYGGPFYQF
jgi:hypothetical protein